MSFHSFSSFLFRSKLFLRHHLLLNGKSESGGTYAASYTWCKYQYDLWFSPKLHPFLQPRQLYSFTIPDMNFGEQFRIGVRTINDKNNLESLIEWLVLRAPNCLDVLGFNYTLCGGLWCVEYPYWYYINIVFSLSSIETQQCECGTTTFRAGYPWLEGELVAAHAFAG